MTSVGLVEVSKMVDGFVGSKRFVQPSSPETATCLFHATLLPHPVDRGCFDTSAQGGELSVEKVGDV